LTTVPHRVGENQRNNKEVRRFLLDYECREVVWDGRYSQQMWSPQKGSVGLWPPERKNKKQGAQAFGPTGGLFYMGQTTTTPPQLDLAMQECHGPAGLDEWRDFNWRTYHQLHHNSNHWTYQALRYLNLPDGSSAKTREEIMAPIAVENAQLNPWKAAFVHWLVIKRPSFLFGFHPRQYTPWVSKECAVVADQLGKVYNKGHGYAQLSARSAEL